MIQGRDHGYFIITMTCYMFESARFSKGWHNLQVLRMHCISMMAPNITQTQLAPLQVVMKEDQTAEEGEQIARDLMSKLGVEEADLITGAYIDLLCAQNE